MISSDDDAEDQVPTTQPTQSAQHAQPGRAAYRIPGKSQQERAAGQLSKRPRMAEPSHAPPVRYDERQHPARTLPSQQRPPSLEEQLDVALEARGGSSGARATAQAAGSSPCQGGGTKRQQQPRQRVSERRAFIAACVCGHNRHANESACAITSKADS